MPRRKNAADAAAETTETTNQMTETVEKKAPAKTSKKGTPVSAAELLQIVSKLEGSPADKVAQAAGYYTEYTTVATGDVDVRVTPDDQFRFMQALLAAQGGPSIAAPVRSSRRSNRQPIIKIGKTGNIVVGGRYTSIAGFAFGEDLDSRVRVEAEAGRITIYAASPEEYAADDQDGADDLDDDSSDLDL